MRTKCQVPGNAETERNSIPLASTRIFIVLGTMRGLKVDCDEEGNGGDDDADAFRYAVASKARKVMDAEIEGILRKERMVNG